MASRCSRVGHNTGIKGLTLQHSYLHDWFIANKYLKVINYLLRWSLWYSTCEKIEEGGLGGKADSSCKPRHFSFLTHGCWFIWTILKSWRTCIENDYNYSILYLHNTIIHRFYHPKNLHSIVLDFPWDIFMSQEKLQTMIMQNLGGKRGVLWDLCK